MFGTRTPIRRAANRNLQPPLVEGRTKTKGLAELHDPEGALPSSQSFANARGVRKLTVNARRSVRRALQCRKLRESIEAPRLGAVRERRRMPPFEGLRGFSQGRSSMFALMTVFDMS
jgi:hypothetical protein